MIKYILQGRILNRLEADMTEPIHENLPPTQEDERAKEHHTDRIIITALVVLGIFLLSLYLYTVLRYYPHPSALIGPAQAAALIPFSL
jgi:hypothetical protein